MNPPTISVLMATYNHAPFVSATIASVLGQRGVDLEFLIEDDGSRDATRDVVSRERDARIHFTPREHNLGACATLNRLLGRARGEFVAIINSDDIWATPDKLAMQLDLLRSRPEVGATFGRAAFIDADGGPLAGHDPTGAGSIFHQPNRSRGRWLRRFYDAGNCLCHPTVLIRKAIYDTLGSYDNRLRQVPDLDMWIRVAKHHELHVADDVLVKFRLMPGENASAHTQANVIRAVNEYHFVFEPFFDGVDLATMKDGFGDLLLNPEPKGERELDVEKTLLMFRGQPQVKRLLALRKLHAMLGDPDYRRILADYEIDDLWLQRELTTRIFDPSQQLTAGTNAPVSAPGAAAAAPTAPEPPPKPRPLMRYMSFLRR